MSANTYWNLLVLVGVLCLGINTTFAEKDIDESSELRVRQKRVINRQSDVKQMIRDVPYIVNIKQLYKNEKCVGVILSERIVLTVPMCVVSMKSCRVYSGTTRKSTHSINKSSRHKVTDTRLLMANHESRPSDEGIALITVTPSFTYSANTRSIPLYQGTIHPQSLGTVTGWGCDDGANAGTEHPNYLRSITVPIINKDHCAALYNNVFPILDSDICTLDPTGNQYCGVDDAGAPLVITENFLIKLAGVRLWKGVVGNGSIPDVFINLQNAKQKNWIARTIEILNHNNLK